LSKKEMYFVGVDIGTSSVKLCVIDETGKILFVISSSYPTINGEPGTSEQNPEVWVEATIKTLCKLPMYGVDPKDVVTLGIAGQVDGVVALNKEGVAVGNALIWMDRRAERESVEIRKHYDDKEIYRKTGVRNDPSHMLPKIMWLHRRFSKKVVVYCPPVTYVTHRLGGETATDHTNASYSLMYDVQKGRWWDEIIELCGLDSSLLPPIVSSCSVIGEISNPALTSLGFSKTEILAGAGDQEAALFASGLKSAGSCLDITGSAEPVCICTDEPVFHSRAVLEVHPRIDRKGWILENPGVTSGAAYKWFAKILKLDDYRDADRLALESPVGSHGLIFLPFLSGSITPEWNEKMRGCFLGLSSTHTAGDMLRSIMEGSAYSLRSTIELANEENCKVQTLVCAGGGAKSDLWVQIKTDVTGIIARRPKQLELTSYGAALLGFPEKNPKQLDFDEFHADEENHQVYSRLYRKFIKAYYCLANEFFNFKEV